MQLGFLLLAAAAAGGIGAPKGDSAAWHTVTGAASPAQAGWARPLEGGAIRALFVGPRYGLRDVVELAQRIDLEYDTVALWDAFHLGGDAAGEEALPPGADSAAVSARIDALLKKPRDVIVLANMDVGLLSAAQQSALVDAVTRGTGLVLVHRREERPPPLQNFLDEIDALPEGVAAIARGVGESDVPGWPGAGTWLRAGGYREGRVVEIAWPGGAPALHCLAPVPPDPLNAFPAYYEHALSLAARALRWAARREPAVWIAGVQDITPRGPDAEEIPPDLLPEFVQSMQDSAVAQPVRPFRLLLNAPADRAYSVKVQLRQLDDTGRPPVRYSFEAALPKGATAYPLDLLAGPGSHVLDVWLSGKKGVADWFTQPLEIRDWPEFGELELFKRGAPATYLYPNDALDARLVLRSTLDVAGLPRSCTVYARGVDTFGRLVAETKREMPAAGGPVELRLEFADLIAPVVVIEVFAIEGGPRGYSEAELSRTGRAAAYLPVRQAPLIGETSLLAASPPLDEYNARFLLGSLAAAGVDTVHAPSTPAALYAAAAARVRMLPEVARYEGAAEENSAQRMPCLTDPAYREGEGRRLEGTVLETWAGGMAHYSLGSPSRFCAGEAPVCQSETCMSGFRTWLAAAYDGLGALNAAWGAAFLVWDDVTLPKPAKDGARAPWVDFRRYMDETYVRCLGFARERVRAVDRQGRVGFRAAAGDRANDGYAWGALLRQLDFLAVPPAPGAVERLRSGQPPGAYTGLVFDAGGIEDATAYARWLPWHGALRQIPAVWHTAPFGTAAAGVAQAALFPDGRVQPLFESLAAECRKLKDGPGALLLQARRVPASIAVLDCPESRAFNYVSGGTGTAQADAAWMRLLERLGYAFDVVDVERLRSTRPGLYKALVLSRAPAMAEETVRAVAAFAAGGGALLADCVPGEFDAHGVRRAQIPFEGMFTGDGKGLLLEQPLPDPGSEEGRGGRQPWVAAVDAQLAAAGCARVLDFETKGGPFAEVERFRYQFGAGEIVALLVPHDAAQSTVSGALRFDKGANAVNLLTGERAPRAQRVAVQLSRGASAIYSVLPYRVERVEVLAPPGGVAGKRLPVRITVRTKDGPAPGAHLVRVDLHPGRGAPLKHYRRYVLCDGGAGEVYIPLARNEVLGTYTVTAHDLLTGQSGTAPTSVTTPAAS